LFARRLRHMDGFMSKLTSESEESYEQFGKEIQKVQDDIAQIAKTLQVYADLRSETRDEQVEDPGTPCEDQVKINKLRRKLRNIMRKRWYTAKKTVLEEMFKNTKSNTDALDASDAFGVNDDNSQSDSQKNVFFITTETYAGDPNTCFLNHKQMVRLGFMTGLEGYTHIYKYTTTTTIEVVLQDDPSSITDDT
jgi:hypothetical protein